MTLERVELLTLATDHGDHRPKDRVELEILGALRDEIDHPTVDDRRPQQLPVRLT